jgi:hypothetical protein
MIKFENKVMEISILNTPPYDVLCPQKGFHMSKLKKIAKFWKEEGGKIRR